MKPSMYEELDKAMLEILIQPAKSKRNPVSGPICAKRAEFFFYALGMDGDFNLCRLVNSFKQRHSIREINIRNERLSGDETAVEDFCSNFRDYIERENLQPEQIYNADET